MKFQNPIIHSSEVMLCIKKRNGRTDAQTFQKQYALLRRGHNKTSYFSITKNYTVAGPWDNFQFWKLFHGLFIDLTGVL